MKQSDLGWDEVLGDDPTVRLFIVSSLSSIKKHFKNFHATQIVKHEWPYTFVA